MGVYAVTGDLVLDGDANRDGTTNGDDLTTVLSNYNKTGATWAKGDFDGNGTVNGADLTIVLSNYNQTLNLGQVGNLSYGAAVPEPATMALLPVVLLAGLARLRGRDADSWAAGRPRRVRACTHAGAFGTACKHAPYLRV